MTVISSKELTKRYGNKRAVNNFDLSIKRNTITGLVGRNGAGKTTLLKILAGQKRHTSGSVKVFNELPFNNLFVSANTIFVSEELEFPVSLNLLEILETASSFYPKWNMDFAKRLFSYFNFEEKEYFHQLSKGKRSTFSMIVGLATRCSLTLFDEPTSGMDLAVRKDFYRILLKDYIDHARTFIISSHYLEEIEDLLEDLLLIDEGRKILHLPIDEVKNYAISVTAPKAYLQQIPEEKWILKTNLDDDLASLIVKRGDLPDTLTRENLTIRPVSPSDLSIYLTGHKGGIDDVLYSTKS